MLHYAGKCHKLSQTNDKNGSHTILLQRKAGYNSTGKQTCSLGLMLKLPAVGFIQATYWVLCISFKVNLFLSYLKTENARSLGFIHKNAL